MNEEEAIKNVKEQLKGIKKANECGLATKGEFNKDIEAIESVLNLLEKKDEEIEKYKMMLAENCARTLNSNLKQKHKHEEDLEALHLGWKEEIEKKDNKIALLEQSYKELQNDFDNFKKDKDINYLDGIHHKKLVEKSIGQIIDKPEECWFDIFEVKVIKNNKLYGVAINEDFVTLKQISDESPEECITVIAESPLSGTIYRYNNYGDKKWQLIGTMLGYE